MKGKIREEYPLILFCNVIFNHILRYIFLTYFGIFHTINMLVLLMEVGMKNKCKKVGKMILALLVPVIIFYLFEWYTHNPWEDIRWDIQLLNILFFELIMLLLYSVIGRLHVALVLETLVFMVYGLANYFVLSFRSEPIQPWDFLSIGTAASVAGDFQYELNTQASVVLAGFVLLLAVELLFCRNRLKHTVSRFYRGPFKSWALRGPAAAGALAFLFLFISLLHDEEFVQQEIKMYDKLFTPAVMSERDGTAVAFLLELQYIAVDKPEGYEKEEAEELFAVEAMAQKEDFTQDLPNIIVIMDEAFCDPAVLGDFETNMDYMPFLHRMQEGGENAITGNLHVSVKGGNTANTEFEFLTGNTMAFLPQGSIPYQQYINTEQPSLASYLAGLGYVTRAAHPYYASGWERDTVYPLLGFMQSDFLDSFSGAGKLRKYVSDASAFDFIVESYEEKEAGKPLFFFEVTMQNHSGYTEEFDNFTPDITVEGSDSLALRQYLSLLKETDKALEELTTYFAEQEEDTIIVFFGDHQPADSVVEPVWRLQGKTGSELTEEELALRYEVPFLIWANFDIEEAQDMDISANYLGGLVLETAGLSLPVYQSYLEELRKDVPVISAQHMITADGYTGMPDGYEGWLTEKKEDAMEGVEEEWQEQNVLSDYRKMQYYLLFDSK